MFGALLRSALPSMRSLSVKCPSFLCDYGRNAACFRSKSPLSLMGAVLREKSCLKTNKSAAKRFIVRGNGRIKRWEFIPAFNSSIQIRSFATSPLIICLTFAKMLRGKGGRSHNTGHKGRKRVNQLAASAPISEKAIEERMRRLIRAWYKRYNGGVCQACPRIIDWLLKLCIKWKISMTREILWDNCEEIIHHLVNGKLQCPMHAVSMELQTAIMIYLEELTDSDLMYQKNCLCLPLNFPLACSLHCYGHKMHLLAVDWVLQLIELVGNRMTRSLFRSLTILTSNLYSRN